MSFEQDAVEILGGVRHGLTLGSPIAVRVGNSEWPKWETVMSADPVDPAELEGLGRAAALTRPRPGHADLVGMQKYGFDDARPVLERASARETAARVALGAVAKAFLAQALDAEVLSHVVSIGAAAAPEGSIPARGDGAAIDADPVRCFDAARAARRWSRRSTPPAPTATPSAASSRSSCTACRPGLGSHTHWDRRLDSRLAGALMGIQAIKGVEVGDGFATARRRGSEAHDEIENSADGVRRRTGRSGGTEGGMSTGEVLRVRAPR